MTLETRQGDKYVKAFHDKYPNAVQFKSNEFASTVSNMREQVRWGQENLVADAFVKCYKITGDGVRLEWFLTDDVDVMAVKLKWT